MLKQTTIHLWIYLQLNRCILLSRRFLGHLISLSKIAQAVASSGIATTLLYSGHTVHSALALSLNLQAIEESTCNHQSDQKWWELCRLAKSSSWMNVLYGALGLEALDRTIEHLRYILIIRNILIIIYDTYKCNISQQHSFLQTWDV